MDKWLGVCHKFFLVFSLEPPVRLWWTCKYGLQFYISTEQQELLPFICQNKTKKCCVVAGGHRFNNWWSQPVASSWWHLAQECFIWLMRHCENACFWMFGWKWTDLLLLLWRTIVRSWYVVFIVQNIIQIIFRKLEFQMWKKMTIVSSSCSLSWFIIYSCVLCVSDYPITLQCPFIISLLLLCSDSK